MSDVDLTLVQRYALLVLMAEAREVPNAHLEKVRGLALKKKEHRDPLERAGLIEVRQERKGGPLSIELTDKGWSRAKAEFGQPVPARAGSAGAALYAVLDKIGQFIERSNVTAADVFASSDEIEIQVDEPDLAAPDLEARIRKAYGEVAARAGDWVMLDKLRRALGPAPRDEVDAALIRLYGVPDVRLVPESNQKVLTADERAAAVSIGNQDKHLIAIGV
jgi:hypothetical protein